MEQWKDVVGYENYYEVSSLGRVRSKERILPHNINSGLYKKKPRILSLRVARRGYKIVWFCVDGVRKAYPVHRLVAIAFLPNPDNKPQVNHKDGNKLNNEVSNLEWVTAKENVDHAVRTGLIKSGSASPMSVLTEPIVKEIKIKLNNGDTQQSVVNWLLDTYNIKVSRGLIGLISTGARWSQVKVD